MDFRHTFGENVKRARRKIDISQERLSLESGLDRTAVGKMERGQSDLRLSSIRKLAKVLKMPPEELVKGVGVDREGPKA